MAEPVIQRSFAAGEIAPALHARADQVKYVTGLKTCRNFLVRREGGVANRPGFRFVAACKTDDPGTRLMRYVGATPGDSYAIEMGQGYFRFYKAGARVRVAGVPAYSGATAYVPGDLVSSGGVNYYCHTPTTGNAPPHPQFWYALEDDIYEIPTPYLTGSGLPKWNQSGNVITLTHPSQAPRELIYEGPTRWILRTVSTGPSISAPTNLQGTAGTAGSLSYAYIVTAAADETFEESVPAGPVIITCDEPAPDTPNVLTWNPVPGAAEYYVYLDPYGNGVYGYIGAATGTTFNDPGLEPDFNTPPPTARLLFQQSGQYPSVSAVYQQRRWFANSLNEPDAIWGSRIGFPSNFGISSPLQDDDAVTFRIAGNNHHPVRHMVALPAGLIVMTDGGEWTVTGGGGPRSPITPSSIDARQETYAGVDPDVRPEVVGNAVLYVQARGTIVRDLRFTEAVQGLDGRDLTIFATHLFETRRLRALAYQQVPHSILWAVRDDGTLLGLTYIPEQDIWGWHRHDTDGAFEAAVVVPERDEDVLYVIVRRTVNGAVRRYVERMASRAIRPDFTHADAFFVDSGLSYSSGVPADEFAGLDHLEGKVVAVVADGQVISNGDPDSPQAATYTVRNGRIRIPRPAHNVHIGLPIRFAELELLDLDVQGLSIRDRKKRVVSVTLLVDRSARSFLAGPSFTRLKPYQPQTWESTSLDETGPLELTLTTEFTPSGRVCIRQRDPLPLTIIGVIPRVEVGG